MIDFREEIVKFKPVLEIEDLEKAISGTEVHDLMDIIQQMTKQIKANKDK